MATAHQNERLCALVTHILTKVILSRVDCKIKQILLAIYSENNKQMVHTTHDYSSSIKQENESYLITSKNTFFSFNVWHCSSKLHTLWTLNLASGLVPPGLVPSSQKTFNKHLLNEQEKEGKNEWGNKWVNGWINSRTRKLHFYKYNRSNTYTCIIYICIMQAAWF